jgi:RNA polymerase sigma-70 factor (ECF subfamily)
MSMGRARVHVSHQASPIGVSFLEQRDRKLVAQCQKGDEEAFRTLVEKYHKKAYSIALGMVHNPEDALDVTQEAFIKVHKYIDNFKGSSSFYTWLYRIVINLCIDFLRREGKYSTVGYDDALTHGKEGEVQEPVVPAEHVDNPNPSHELGRKEVGEQIQRAIELLSPNHRAVILMREVEGLSYREMARILGCSQGTVMSRLHHARYKLRKLLKEYIGPGKSTQSDEDVE